MIKNVGFYFISLVLALSIGCSKGGCNLVPNVSFSTNVNRVEHNSFYVSGGWSYASGGVCGLILYNNGSNGLIAYDRCSVVNIQDRNKVIVDGLTIVDQISGAKWLLIDGSPMAIAECSLKPYPIRQSGDNYVVSN